jgi:hypothetical protein
MQKGLHFVGHARPKRHSMRLEKYAYHGTSSADHLNGKIGSLVWSGEVIHLAHFKTGIIDSVLAWKATKRLHLRVEWPAPCNSEKALCCGNFETAALYELVAQLVEHRPFKALVLGSSPSELTTPSGRDFPSR